MAKQKAVDKEDLKKEIEKLLKQYQKSEEVHHEDIKHIADVYFASGEQQKEDMIKHYTVNGSVFINAVFNNNVEVLESLAEE